MNKIYPFCLSLICFIVFLLNSIDSFAESNRLASIKQAIEQKDLHWTAGENWVTRLSPQERRKLFMGSYESPVLAKSDIFTVPQIGDLPEKLDWRNISQNEFQGNYVTSVKNQGVNCGSCWAFSAVAQVESWWLIDNNRPDTTLDLSEQILISSGYAGSCEGGNVDSALEWAQKKGIPPEWCFEYRERDLPLDSAYADWGDYAYTIPGWNYISGIQANVSNIKNALMYHPVSAHFEVYSDFYWYNGGVYEPAIDSTEGWHAILIVGWNDADSSWICKNSWGDYWGNYGYFKIKWGVCHIGEYIPFIWNEVGEGSYVTVGMDSVCLSLTQGDSAEIGITVFNSGPRDVNFAALCYSVPVKFHLSDFNAYEGTSWWCGDSELGGYGNHWFQYLQTPILDFSGTQNAKLRWKGYWALEEPIGTDPPWDGWDGCNVWISTDGGENFTVIEPEFPQYNCQHLWSFGHPDEGWNLGTDIAGWAGKSRGWKDVEFDLSEYNSEAVILRWALASDLAYCAEDDPSLYGFFIDDIVILDGNIILFENHGEDEGEILFDGNGSEAIDWLSINNGVGTISAGGQIMVDLSINTQNLAPGNYKGSVFLTVSDTLQNTIIIPIDLAIVLPEDLSLKLYNNYPNPFNNDTKISYYLPEMTWVKLKIYDIRGRETCTLVNRIQYSGLKQITWDGKNNAGRTVSSGMYIYTLQTDRKVLSQKMLLIR